VRVLIFGADGQAGRALQASAPAGARLVAMGRAGCDFCDENSIRGAIRNSACDAIINAAAFTGVDQAESDHELAHLVNATAPGIIAAEAVKLGLRLVHLSTDYVFDGQSAMPYKPSSAPNPINTYGVTKLLGERAVLDSGVAALIVRTSWVHAGAGKNFTLTMLSLMRERPSIKVVCDQIGTPTWAQTLAQSIWGLLATRAGGIFHVTDAGVASWYDFAVAIGEEALATGLIERIPRIVPIPAIEYPTPAKRPAFGVLDKSDTWSILGSPAPHWRQSLRQMLKELPRHG
jgi:dTDP-4-dehydrorhamnose reductase